MHLTTITLKNGKQVCGFIEKVKLARRWESCSIKLFDYPPLFVRNIKLVVTEKDRISARKIGDIDELKYLKKIWNLERKEGRE